MQLVDIIHPALRVVWWHKALVAATCAELLAHRFTHDEPAGARHDALDVRMPAALYALICEALHVHRLTTLLTYGNLLYKLVARWPQVSKGVPCSRQNKEQQSRPEGRRRMSV